MDFKLVEVGQTYYWLGTEPSPYGTKMGESFIVENVEDNKIKLRSKYDPATIRWVHHPDEIDTLFSRTELNNSNINTIKHEIEPGQVWVCPAGLRFEIISNLRDKDGWHIACLTRQDGLIIYYRIPVEDSELQTKWTLKSLQISTSTLETKIEIGQVWRNKEYGYEYLIASVDESQRIKVKYKSIYNPIFRDHTMEISDKFVRYECDLISPVVAVATTETKIEVGQVWSNPRARLVLTIKEDRGNDIYICSYLDPDEGMGYWSGSALRHDFQLAPNPKLAAVSSGPVTCRKCETRSEYATYMNRYVVLYRDLNYHNEDVAEKNAACAAGFIILQNRSEIQPGDFVIPRYSSLPYYRELEEDVNILGGKLINSFTQHNYVADIKNYLTDLKELTPETWDRLEDLPENCAFVLKGQTNSRKNDWSELMFAENKKQASEVYSRLCKDGLVGTQDIYIRKYVPLKTYMVGIKDLPITHEFRFFIGFGQVLSSGYYWSSHVTDLETIPDPETVPKSFLTEVIKRIGNKINFYVIDVAQTVEGNWIVIELNCGTMSGLSENNPNILYSNLKKTIEHI